MKDGTDLQAHGGSKYLLMQPHQAQENLLPYLVRFRKTAAMVSFSH
jgi:hypothetical protein